MASLEDFSKFEMKISVLIFFGGRRGMLGCQLSSL